VNSLNRYYASSLISAGRYQEAENMIDQLADDSGRRAALIDLAKMAFAKDAEANRDIALNALRKVRSTMAERPVDQATTVSFVQIAIAYAPIDADEAFNTMDAVIPVLNELADANAVVQAFRSDMVVRQGEYMMLPNPAYGFQLDADVWRALVKADAERTAKLIDRFARRELRITVRFQMIADAPPPPPGRVR
jgi:hypothetical protein